MNQTKRCGWCGSDDQNIVKPLEWIECCYGWAYFCSDNNKECENKYDDFREKRGLDLSKGLPHCFTFKYAKERIKWQKKIEKQKKDDDDQCQYHYDEKRCATCGASENLITAIHLKTEHRVFCRNDRCCHRYVKFCNFTADYARVCGDGVNYFRIPKAFRENVKEQIEDDEYIEMLRELATVTETEARAAVGAASQTNCDDSVNARSRSRSPHDDDDTIDTIDADAGGESSSLRKKKIDVSTSVATSATDSDVCEAEQQAQPAREFDVDSKLD